MALTLSCSSDDKDDGNPPAGGVTGGLSSSGGGNNGGGSSSSGGGTPNGGSGGCPNAVTTPVNASDIGSVSCGGQVYKTVKIGEQVWMAENLNYNATGSKCGNGSSLSDANTSTCDAYGRLYNWSTALTACPSGWHLPSDADWNVLMKFVNLSCADNSSCADAGTKLKARSGWNEDGNGTDNYGFAALPGGIGYSVGGFGTAGSNGLWWSATEDDADNAFIWSMRYEYEGVFWFSLNKSYLFSVRCLQD